MSLSAWERERLLRRLRIYFSQRRQPRFVMSAVLLLTGIAGFFTSALLLRCGFEKMWIRYPLAATAGWLVFLALMRLWATWEKRAVPDSNLDDLAAAHDPGDPQNDVTDTSAGTIGDWLDLAKEFVDLPDDLDGCLFGTILLIASGVIFFAFIGIITLIAGAPALIAELFLDAILVTALYKRVRTLDRQWWLTGVINRTIGPFILTAVALMIVGAMLKNYAPEAKSIGGVIEHYRAKHATKPWE